jgi:hypothetical protein
MSQKSVIRTSQPSVILVMSVFLLLMTALFAPVVSAAPASTTTVFSPSVSQADCFVPSPNDAHYFIKQGKFWAEVGVTCTTRPRRLHFEGWAQVSRDKGKTWHTASNPASYSGPWDMGILYYLPTLKDGPCFPNTRMRAYYKWSGVSSTGRHKSGHFTIPFKKPHYWHIGSCDDD